MLCLPPAKSAACVAKSRSQSPTAAAAPLSLRLLSASRTREARSGDLVLAVILPISFLEKKPARTAVPTFCSSGRLANCCCRRSGLLAVKAFSCYMDYCCTAVLVICKVRRLAKTSRIQQTTCTYLIIL